MVSNGHGIIPDGLHKFGLCRPFVGCVKQRSLERVACIQHNNILIRHGRAFGINDGFQTRHTAETFPLGLAIGVTG